MAPTLRQIAGVFTRYANLTFGGGSATIAVLHREIVGARVWLDQERFNLTFALSRLTPGTNLLAFCAGVGWFLRGIPGAAVALLAASIPCALLVLIVTYAFDRWSDDPIAQIAIQGAMAAAVGITLMTCWVIAKPYVKRTTWVRAAIFVGVAFAVDALVGVSAVQVLIVAGVIGFLFPGKPA